MTFAAPPCYNGGGRKDYTGYPLPKGVIGMSDYEIIMILLTVLGFLMAVVKLLKK